MIRKLSFFYLFIFFSFVFAGEEPNYPAECNAFINDTSEQDLTDIPDTPFNKGLLWKIEKDGKENYIFGTMHSQDYAVSPIPPKVRLALAKSNTLLIETIPNEEANQTFLNMMYFKDKQRLDHLLEPALLDTLIIIIQDYGVAAEHANFVKPWAAFSLIGRPKPVRAPTLESNLLKAAQQSMLQIKSLETMEEILSALDGLAMNDQVVILKDTICNHEQIIHDTKMLVDLYINRDLQGMLEFNNQPHYDEAVFVRFMQRILYDRNTRMLKRIENEFKSGNVFVAVGASHLAGANGLLNELSKKSYSITQIY
ncbi:MAG: TraB/GumN family protein [Proteobacteria bacterium]|nr:TraB/GumN family protein [Pseudomonadota bacterium]NOG60846.1 TraB/GumN family protein [Pseudomonadota bacterium]